jgi:hypothetical protein
MKVDVRSMAITSGLLWGTAVLAVGLVNVIKPHYGRRFLRMVSSIYPGYQARSNAADAMVGAGYALLDGAIGGAIFAALYNRIEKAGKQPQQLPKAA